MSAPVYRTGKIQAGTDQMNNRKARNEMERHTLTKQQVTMFGDYLKNLEKARATVEKYVRDIKAFFVYCRQPQSAQIESGNAGGAIKVIEGSYGGNAGVKYGEVSGQAVDFSKNTVIHFKEWLTINYKPASVNSMLAALNSFFRFAGWEDCIVKPLKIQRQIFLEADRLLDRRDYMKLVNEAQMRNKQQLKLVMETLCSTGMRVSELAFVTVETLKKGCVTILCKGKIRKIFLPRKLCLKLKAYASSMHIKQGYLFMTKNGKPLDRKRIWADMKKLGKNAGIKADKVFPHNLRHLFATLYYRLERDIAKLADILGHSSINTTRLYILTDGMEHRKHLERLNLIYE